MIQKKVQMGNKQANIVNEKEVQIRTTTAMAKIKKPDNTKC